MDTVSGSGRLLVYGVRGLGDGLLERLREAGRWNSSVEFVVGAVGGGSEAFRAVYESAVSGDVILFVGACGIAVRFLDGLLRAKRTDPAVLVLDDAARHCVVLVGGHEGGGNRMAYRVAELTGAVPVVTTASEALRPVVLGVGSRRGVALSVFVECFEQAGERYGVTLDAVREVVTVDVKKDERGLREWVERVGIPLRIIGLEALKSRPWVLERSSWVGKTLGVAGVSEACALAVSPRSVLLGRRHVHAGVTMAFARDAGFQTGREE